MSSYNVLLIFADARAPDREFDIPVKCRDGWTDARQLQVTLGPVSAPSAVSAIAWSISEVGLRQPIAVRAWCIDDPEPKDD